jgi:hypothetical protein
MFGAALVRGKSGFPRIAFAWHGQMCTCAKLYLIHKLYVRIVSLCRLMGLQIIPPLERAVSTFLFVLNVWRVPFDLEFLYTASEPFRL